jgi:hypothetical protein
MSKAVAFACLVVGVILLVWGFSARDSAASEISEVVSGSPSDKAIWLLAGGALLTIAGGISLLMKRNP